VPIRDAIKRLPELIQELKKYDPVASAVRIAGLLTEPRLLANTVRLELLIHLLLAVARKNRKPTPATLTSWVNDYLGDTAYASMEDPIEDVFVTNVMTDEGNFRLFEGTWEYNDFYLQRVLNAIATLPDDDDSRLLRNQIRAMLKISDEVARRRKLQRFVDGGGAPNEPVTLPSDGQIGRLQSSITFTEQDLHGLSVKLEDIGVFVCDKTNWSDLKNQTVLPQLEVERPMFRLILTDRRQGDEETTPEFYGTRESGPASTALGGEGAGVRGVRRGGRPTDPVLPLAKAVLREWRGSL